MRGGHGIDSFAAVQEEVVGSCEHSDELFFYVRGNVHG
jgi:hypothetical protein